MDPVEQAAATAAQVENLQNVLAGMFDRLNALENQQHVIAAGQTPQRVHDKPPKPETFKGTTEQATHVRTWVNMVKNFFSACGTTEIQKLPYAVALLRDDALVWYLSLAEEDRPGTFNEFCTSLIEYYQPISAQMAARDELAHLKQRTTVKAYTDEFKRIIANIPDMSASEKMDRYERGLKPEVRVHVALADPPSLEEWIKRAEKVDEIMNKRHTARREKISIKEEVDPSDIRNTPAPMEINTITASRLTDKDRETLKNSGSCFYCRKPGHIARDCPKKRR
jgi:hypothetical protein